MNYIEKKIDYVVNKVTHHLPFGDKDDITKEFVYKKLNINNDSIEKIKNANLELLSGLNRMLVEADKLTNDKRYYSKERKKVFNEYKARVEHVIENRKTLNRITNDEDELIDHIQLNVETIFHYREELADIISIVQMPAEKHESFIWGLIDLINNSSKNKKEKLINERVNQIIENSYLDPLEEKMLKNGEFDPSDFDDDRYQEEEDFDE